MNTAKREHRIKLSAKFYKQNTSIEFNGGLLRVVRAISHDLKKVFHTADLTE